MSNDNELERPTSDWKAKSRSWGGTLNNPTEEEIEKMLNCEIFQYVAGTIEYGQETHTRHWQFWTYAKNPIRLSTLTKLIPRAKWIQYRGSAEEQIAYILKNRPVDVASGYDNTGNLEHFRESGTRPTTENRLKGILYTICTMNELVETMWTSDNDDNIAELSNYIDMCGIECYNLIEDTCPCCGIPSLGDDGDDTSDMDVDDDNDFDNTPLMNADNNDYVEPFIKYTKYM
jgi:hypothetical protein